MQFELMMLGGVEEIGANSCFMSFDGVGIIVDAGLHPKRRDALALPDFSAIQDRSAAAILITHAHTDHLGALPFAMHHQPQMAVFMTRATRDLSEIMLRNSSRLLRTEVAEEFPREALAQYRPEIVRNLSVLIQGMRLDEEFTIAGAHGGGHDIRVRFCHAGHILGAAGVLFDVGGRRILHSGDVHFGSQELIAAAELPREHVDVLVLESTNGAQLEPAAPEVETRRLAELINRASNAGGSVLIPAFALGKTQEMLKRLHKMMNAGMIPRLPMYSGGLSAKINIVYDRYCYTVPRVDPGFEMTDIAHAPIDYKTLMSGPYFKHPSIVLATSGMLNAGTTAFKLAHAWMQRPNFAIAFAGYLDEDSPGYALAHSARNEEFLLAGRKVKRVCEVGRFRFSAHAMRADLIDYVWDVRPNHLFLVHGDSEACESLGAAVKSRLPQCRIRIPRRSHPYVIDLS